MGTYAFLDRRAADAMTRRVVSVAPGTPLREVEALFEKHDFNGIPVVGAGGVLLGLVTKLDLLQAFALSPASIVPDYGRLFSLPVERVMACAPACVAPETPLPRVLEELVRTRYKSLPVVRQGRLVGIVSREDVLRALLHTAA